MYTVFQTVISDISPWTVSFTERTTTNNTTKVTFSLLNTRKGVEITKWKELTFFLPSEVKKFSSKDSSPFTVQFLGTRVDYGELPHNIFQAHIFKSALGAMLKMIDGLPVCPGIYDPALVDMAETKAKICYILLTQKEQL